MLSGVLEDDLTPAIPALTPRGTLDFVNNVYNFDSSTLTLSSVVDTPSRRSASGLSIICGSPVQLLGTPLTFVLTGLWTIVIQFNFTDSGSTGGPGLRLFLLTMFDAGQNDQVAIYTIGDIPDSGGPSGVAFEDSGVTTRGPSGVSQVGVGVSRIAVTRVTADLAESLAGEIAQADNTAISIASWTFPPSQVQLADGNNTGNTEGYIEKITFYDPVSDAVLPNLSI